jgi:DNA repair protein RadC
LQASQTDIDLTKKLREGGKLLNIQILDHIILTSEAYYSFADEGLL